MCPLHTLSPAHPIPAQYAAFHPRTFWNIVCRLAMLLSTACALLGVVLVWVMYPSSFSYGSALRASLSFYDTQRIGRLPQPYPIQWRSSALGGKGEMLGMVGWV
jgi:hypothetical protein